MDIRIFRHQELLYEGRRMAFMRSYFTQMWDIDIDVSAFPGVADLSSLAIKRALAFARHDCARPQFGFAETHATMLFLGYLGFAQEDLDEMATASSECLSSRLVIEGLRRRCSKLLMVHAMAMERDRFLHDEPVRDLEVPLAAAYELSKFRDQWAQESSVAMLVTPSPEQSRKWMFREPDFFSDVFPWSSWFPRDFQWSCSKHGIGFALKGGAAAHMLHGNGFGDMDFYVYKIADHGESRLALEWAARALIIEALRCLKPIVPGGSSSGSAVSPAADASRHCEATLLVENETTRTLVVRLADNSVWRMQFFAHLFNSVSEILISSDIDVTQVVYCWDGRIVMSPLALKAYSIGMIALRSDLQSEYRARQLPRLAKYVQRGFGICARLDALSAQTLQALRILGTYRGLRESIEQTEVDLDMPTTFPADCDSGPDSDNLPVDAIIQKWVAGVPLKMLIVTHQVVADNMVVSGIRCRSCVIQKRVAGMPPVWEQASLEFNISRKPTAQKRSGGIRAFVYFMPTHLYHGEFNAVAIHRFLSRDDKCSLPPKGDDLWAADDTIMLHDAASLVLFKLTRTPRELWDALEAHKEIRQVLAAMSANGQEHRLQSGATVYVHPQQRSLAESIIARSGVELRFHHIIASEDIASVISDAVAGIPSRKNVRFREQTRLRLRPSSIAA